MLQRTFLLASAIVLFVTAGGAGAQGYGADNTLAVSTTTPVAGEDLVVAGCCFSGTVVITIASTPQRLGTATADSTGAFRTTVTIPADIAPGSHTIIATGQALDGSGELVLSIPITVLAATPTGDVDGDAGGESGGGDGGREGALPRTGAEGTLPLAQVGTALVLVGAGVLLSIRNRRITAGRNDKVSTDA